jgi:hypothetical protein
MDFYYDGWISSNLAIPGQKRLGRLEIRGKKRPLVLVMMRSNKASLTMNQSKFQECCYPRWHQGKTACLYFGSSLHPPFLIDSSAGRGSAPLR